jgi:Holliday junction resolvase RusA-like endonuclease
MSYSREIVIFNLPPTPNRSEAHWSGRSLTRASWRQLVDKAINARGLPPHPLERARITCTRFSSKRPDYDNLVASFKSVIDGLVDCGVIEDDADSVLVERSYLWQHATNQESKIIVKVEEVP